jgi:hypothetical protein
MDRVLSIAARSAVAAMTACHGTDDDTEAACVTTRTPADVRDLDALPVCTFGPVALFARTADAHLATSLSDLDLDVVEASAAGDVVEHVHDLATNGSIELFVETGCDLRHPSCSDVEPPPSEVLERWSAVEGTLTLRYAPEATGDPDEGTAQVSMDAVVIENDRTRERSSFDFDWGATQVRYEGF